MTLAYYNEIDPYAAAWLRNMIAAGVIPPGEVDERSIAEVDPADLRRFRQCHFFAGIGGWAVAAHLADWPSERELWTGSCPCQPFSEAGKRKGFADERDLWPEWFRLIKECRPSVVFGEQVPEAIGLGWLDRAAADLERQDYAIGACVLSACVVEARQERERLWFVACADSEPMERPAIARLERNPWPTEPALARVAHGVPCQRERVRAFGNAIVPQVGAEVMRAYLEAA